MKGFVKVERDLFESPLWELDLSVRGAYIDIMQRAAWRPSAAIVNGKSIPLDVGECVVSQRLLSDSWKCNRAAVLSILRTLVKFSLISLHKIDDENRNSYTKIVLSSRISAFAAAPQVIDNGDTRTGWLEITKTSTGEQALTMDKQGSCETRQGWSAQGDYQQLTTRKLPEKAPPPPETANYSNIGKEEGEEKEEYPSTPPCEGGCGSHCEPQRERKRRARFSPPSLLDWLAYARKIGWNEWDATESFHYWNGLGWEFKTRQKIRDWKSICSKSMMYFQKKREKARADALAAGLSADNPPDGWRKVYLDITGLTYANGLSWANVVENEPAIARKIVGKLDGGRG